MGKFKYQSHIGIDLFDHLKDVAIRMKNVSNALNLRYEKFISLKFNKKNFEDLLIFIGVFHDFGKLSSFFQRKLLEDVDDIKSHHSTISAFIGSYIASLYFKDKLETNTLNFFCLVIFITIRRHHSNLKSYDLEFNSLNVDNYSEWNLIPCQLSDIFSTPDISIDISKNYEKILNCKEISIELNSNFILEVFMTIKEKLRTLEKIKEFVKEFYYNNSLQIRLQGNLDYYLLNQLCFSILIDSDKKLASKTEIVERLEIDDKIITNYLAKIRKNSKSNQKINELRDDFFFEIESKSMSDIEKDYRILTMTAPTGLGKTLVSLKYCLKLRNAITKSTELKPRIIYCLPFTSIIDQNYGIIRSLLNQEISDFNKNENAYLIKHHHQAEISYKTQDEKIPLDEALLLIESWDSEIIITTFYQVFQTLFGFRNRDLKKFSKLLNSIIIFDEIQSFPIDYWDVFSKLCMKIVDTTSTKILLLSATQPSIFSDDSVLEIINDKQIYFSNPELDRIKFVYENSNLLVKEFVKSHINKFNLYNSFIFILNTIESSLQVFSRIKNYLLNEKMLIVLDSQNLGFDKKIKLINDQENKFLLLYLSTNIPLIERKERIKLLKYAQENKIKFILISTQIIEAGIDIDADIVIRDLAPLDKLIQAAGRCNRNKNLDQKGIVYINHLISETGISFHEYIYDNPLVEKTKNLLEESRSNKHEYITEKDLFKINEEYYNFLKNDININKKLVEILKKLKYSNKNKTKVISSIDQFQIIKEDYEKENIVLELDNKVKNLIGDLAEKINERKLLTEKGEIKELIQNKIEIKNIKRKIADYSVDIPIDLFNNLKLDIIVSDVYNIKLLTKEKLIQFYNLETGFIRKNSE